MTTPSRAGLQTVLDLMKRKLVRVPTWWKMRSKEAFVQHYLCSYEFKIEEMLETHLPNPLLATVF